MRVGIAIGANIAFFYLLVSVSRLILRRDPPGSLIDTDRAVEFGAYRAFHGTAVPVPEPLGFALLAFGMIGLANRSGNTTSTE